MHLRALFLGLSLVASSAMAGKPPPIYSHLTAAEKAAWHEHQAKATPHRFGYPGTVRMVCWNALAAAGFLSDRYIRRTTESGSGYAGDGWRWLFGKSVHMYGPTARGEVVLDEPLKWISAGTHPATLRFSLANPYLPRVPGGEFRPGLMIGMHQDGSKEDVALFTMPPKGLDGTAKPTNPFTHDYTNSLQVPSESVQKLAALTFGRVVVNVLEQIVSDDFRSVYLKPVGDWATHYDRTRPQDYFGPRLAAMPAATAPTDAFEIYAYDGTTVGRRIGTVRIAGAWINSTHGNGYFWEHKGFQRR